MQMLTNVSISTCSMKHSVKLQHCAGTMIHAEHWPSSVTLLTQDWLESTKHLTCISVYKPDHNVLIDRLRWLSQAFNWQPLCYTYKTKASKNCGALQEPWPTVRYLYIPTCHVPNSSFIFYYASGIWLVEYVGRRKIQTNKNKAQNVQLPPKKLNPCTSHLWSMRS